MRIVERYGEAYQNDQLVVELRDVRLVMQELLGRGLILANPGPPRSSVELSLAVIDLPGLDAGLGSLRQDAKLVEAVKAARRPPYKDSDEISDIDLLLFSLRQDFRQAYDGWAPTMGKNRSVDLIEGWPYIKGGEGPLTPVSGPRIPAREAPGGPRVGILDTTLFAHPDLAGRYVGEAITVLHAPTDSPLGHATFIAGQILTRAPNAELVVGAALDAAGTSRDSWDVATKIVGFGTADVAVLNLSFGCATADREPPLVLSRAVEQLDSRVVMVAAAGNHGELGDVPDLDTGLTGRTPMWPAALDGVVAVGAYDRNDPRHTKPSFTPHGAPWIDLLAPGVGELSTFLIGEVNIVKRENGVLEPRGRDNFPEGYAQWSGTSFAAANVSGQIAAMVEGGRTAQEALHTLLDRTGPGDGDIWRSSLEGDGISG